MGKPPSLTTHRVEQREATSIRELIPQSVGWFGRSLVYLRMPCETFHLRARSGCVFFFWCVFFLWGGRFKGRHKKTTHFKGYPHICAQLESLGCRGAHSHPRVLSPYGRTLSGVASLGPSKRHRNPKWWFRWKPNQKTSLRTPQTVLRKQMVVEKATKGCEGALERVLIERF